MRDVKLRPRGRRVLQPTLPGLEVKRTRRRSRGRVQPAGAPAPGRIGGKPVSRRTFLAQSLGWVAAAIGAALGIPGLVATVAPALRQASLDWYPIGRIDEAGPGEPDLRIQGTPVLTHFVSLAEDAYRKAQPQRVQVYVVNQGNGEFTVFDVRCTHLGCPVVWEQDPQRYVSPCHNGLFDPAGLVIGGPPPRPLDRYETKVEDGVLFVGPLYRVDDSLQRVT
jgi:Rieske Fe-S protein